MANNHDDKMTTFELRVIFALLSVLFVVIGSLLAVLYGYANYRLTKTETQIFDISNRMTKEETRLDDVDKNGTEGLDKETTNRLAADHGLWMTMGALQSQMVEIRIKLKLPSITEAKPLTLLPELKVKPDDSKYANDGGN